MVKRKGLVTEANTTHIRRIDAYSPNIALKERVEFPPTQRDASRLKKTSKSSENKEKHKAYWSTCWQSFFLRYLFFCTTFDSPLTQTHISSERLERLLINPLPTSVCPLWAAKSTASVLHPSLRFSCKNFNICASIASHCVAETNRNRHENKITWWQPRTPSTN